jgi:hypothetical protein
MSDDLEGHRPSAQARRRAHEAGLDLERLRREDPLAYKMITAVPVLQVAAELRTLAEPSLHVALAGQQLFEAKDQEHLQLLAFPGPEARQLERLDDLLAQAVEEITGRYGYYRVVSDRRAVRREFDLPTEPGAWQGQETLVGPFGDESEARDWGLDNVMGRVMGSGALTYDTVRYAGAWFCDIFSAADEARRN